MEHSPSLEANSSSVTEEISLILWKQNFHYRAHRIQQLNP